MPHQTLAVADGVPIKLWTAGVPVEEDALTQLVRTARLPFIFEHIAVMPDVHPGKGSTIGSVIPTCGAVIPAAVGVDIGCGMIAARTALDVRELPADLHRIRLAIERAVPHGRAPGRHDPGAWDHPPAAVERAWAELAPGFERLVATMPELAQTKPRKQLGTLGTGNHFIELSRDEADRVWVMLHSGSRGVGNAIGTRYIALAQKDLGAALASLPDRDLAYFSEGSAHFSDYLAAAAWAQDYARRNRALMLDATLAALSGALGRSVSAAGGIVNCHHNYVARETHFGQPVWVTRKGAVSARSGEMGIIPGSMGAKSYIVRGLGNEEAFCSCSHGAGRLMSRAEAKRRFSLADQIRTTMGVECRKDAAVLDEIPLAYKDIDAVIAAQRDLIEVVHTLRQLVCVKG